MGKSAGYLDIDGKICHLAEATCSFSGGYLDVDASGRRCELSLVGVPFQGVRDLSELRAIYDDWRQLYGV